MIQENEIIKLKLEIEKLKKESNNE
jgi:hypothetical protein